MALPNTKAEALNDRLARLTLPDGGWSQAAREDAAARLRAMGLPGRRDEYWRFTDPRDLIAAEAPVAEPIEEGAEGVAFDDHDALRIVFRDGAFDAAASSDLAGENVEIGRLAEASATDIHWARDAYGRLEAAGQTPVARPLCALNTAYATDGVLIRATGPVARPVCVVYRQSDAGSDVILHHVVHVERGASLTLLESGSSAARANVVLEADVHDEGELHHVRSQGRVHGRRIATAIFARLGAEATFKSFTLSLNGTLTRNEYVFTLTGDDAAAHVAGAAIGDGNEDPFHHDDTVFITHDAERCESRQVFKKVLKNGAVGVFQGKILVKEGAQKTDGYQISQSLLLDDDSQFLAKPELEIYADDVACSHGSTTGAIDEEALFYLRSRGVGKARAQDLLVLAFLAEAMEEVEDEGLAAAVLARLEGWMARHES